MPLIQKAEQGLASRIANGVAGFLTTPGAGVDGQKAPTASTAAPADSARSAAISTLTSTLGTDATKAILSLQDGAASGASQVGGHHHHHRGAAGYKAAATLASDLADQTAAPTGSQAPAAPTAITA